MGSSAARSKRIVAALAAAAWFSAPVAAQEAAGDDGDREADLLRQLAEAETPDAASLIETELVNLWSQSGSPAVDLLLRRGRDAMEAGEPDVAIEHFTAAIDHAPRFAEAHAGRASAYYLTNRVGPALDDLREALVLEPDHFGALQGFAVILEELGQPEAALEIHRRVADMNPQDAEAKAAVTRLALGIEGLAL